ncbi:MAG: GNAT family N-acetyltransferase [Proteocatella sp.]
MNIRLCMLEDHEKWIQLNRKFMDFEQTDEVFWNNADVISDIEFCNIFNMALDSPEHITLMMIEEDGEPIGFLNLLSVFSVWAHGKALVLDDLFIEEEYRGRGIGRSVLKYLEEYTLQNGYKRLQFSSEFSNPSAHSFYTSLGYKNNDMHFYTKYM